ncbi:MAG TPA: hypothetical protein VFV66_01350 [Nonomuraea sp.]|nr:hypothetical protein [Nonomuraea sp.]
MRGEVDNGVPGDMISEVPDEVIGWVDDRPIMRDRLDQRLADLRSGPFSAALPVPGSSEDRQLARWLTQVILTEALCETTASALRLAPVEGPPLDRLAAVELGSINAAAYNGSPWVRAIFDHVTAEVEIPPEWRPREPPSPAPAHLVRHRLFPDKATAEQAIPDDLESLGAVDLTSLPSAIADELRRHPPGTPTTPVPGPLGWHVAIAFPTADPSPPSPEPSRTPTPGAAPPEIPPSITAPSNPAAATPNQPAPAPQGDAGTAGRPAASPERGFASADHHQSPLLEAARRRAFARWLDETRAEKVQLVPGLEHPGDPRQPDNHHKH